MLGREFSNRAYWPVHQLTVNAYALQHAASNPALHLLALCLRFDHGFSDERVLGVMRRAGKEKPTLPAVQAPADLGGVTVVEVHGAVDAAGHIALVEGWARSVWEAWSDSHAAIREAAARYVD